jgi:hypothetical protein
MTFICPTHGRVTYVKDENGVLVCKAIKGSAMGMTDCNQPVAVTTS